MDETGPLDLGGVTLPDFGGRGVDRMQARFLAGLADRALSLASAAAEAARLEHRDVLERIARGIARLGPYDAPHAFRSPLAVAHLEGPAREDLGVDAPVLELQLARFLVGGGLPDFACVLPKETFAPAGGLYFPHLHLWVACQGPLAVDAAASRVSFTWIDGRSATIPAEGFAGQSHGEDLRGGMRVGPWPVLNGLPELEPLARTISPRPHDQSEEAGLHALTGGFDLLSEIWPEAYASATRFLRAVLSQPVAEDHVSSMSHNVLQGALIASLRDPIQCADALVHESAHQRLSLYLRRDSLIVDDGAEAHPSPWRKDPRPLKGLVNGIHSFVSVAGFYRRLAEHRPAEAEFAEAVFEAQRAKLREAWAYLEPRAVPTPTGRVFLAELEREVSKL